MPVFLIGGAEKAAELDAKRAIDQGTRLAAVVENAKTGDVYNAPESLKAKVRLRVRLSGAWQNLHSLDFNALLFVSLPVSKSLLC